MDPVMTVVGWILAPIISLAVTKALECLRKPLKRASEYKAKLSKLEALLLTITHHVAKADGIKVVHPHQTKLRIKLAEAVLQAQRDTLNFNIHYNRLVNLEEAEAAGKKSVVKRWQVFFSVFGLQKNLSKSIKGWQRVERIAKDFIRQSGPQSSPSSAHQGGELVIANKRPRDTEADSPNKRMKTDGAFIGEVDRAENREAINAIIPREKMDSQIIPRERINSPIIPLEGMDSPMIPRERINSPIILLEGMDSPIIPREGMDSPIIPREGTDSQIVEFGRTPLEMCQHAKEVFEKSCPSPLREKYVAARMAKAALEVGVAAATLWQRYQELDSIVAAKEGSSQD